MFFFFLSTSIQFSSCSPLLSIIIIYYYNSYIMSAPSTICLTTADILTRPYLHWHLSKKCIPLIRKVRDAPDLFFSFYAIASYKDRSLPIEFQLNFLTMKKFKISKHLSSCVSCNKPPIFDFLIHVHFHHYICIYNSVARNISYYLRFQIDFHVHFS